MPKKEADPNRTKRTYRFPKNVLALIEAEAAKYRRPVNTQLEMILEEWAAQQAKNTKKDEQSGQRSPTALVLA